MLREKMDTANVCRWCWHTLSTQPFRLKCLPDGLSEVKRDLSENLSEPKPAEPKYHKGEKVCYNGYVYEVEGLVGKNRYALKGLNFDLDEDMIDPYEPYTEPKEKTCTDTCADDCSSQDFDRIAIDGFRSHNRLHIAAMAMAGILSKGELADPDEVTDMALIYADELIEKCEEGGTL